MAGSGMGENLVDGGTLSGQAADDGVPVQALAVLLTGDTKPGEAFHPEIKAQAKRVKDDENGRCYWFGGWKVYAANGAYSHTAYYKI